MLHIHSNTIAFSLILPCFNTSTSGKKFRSEIQSLIKKCSTSSSYPQDKEAIIVPNDQPDA